MVVTDDVLNGGLFRYDLLMSSVAASTPLATYTEVDFAGLLYVKDYIAMMIQVEMLCFSFYLTWLHYVIIVFLSRPLQNEKLLTLPETH